MENGDDDDDDHIEIILDHVQRIKDEQIVINKLILYQ